MRSGVGDSHSKGLGHKRLACTGNERVQWGIVLQVPPSHITHHAAVIDGRGKLHLGISYHEMEQRYRVVTPGDPWIEVKYSRGKVIQHGTWV
jgi:hypothetical protein